MASSLDFFLICFSSCMFFMYCILLCLWKWKPLSHAQLFATPWTIACQAPQSMGLSRQKYWSGLPFPSPRDLSNPEIKLRSPALQADSLPSEPPGKLFFVYMTDFFKNREKLYSHVLSFIHLERYCSKI